jgi:hypothetical protein
MNSGARDSASLSPFRLPSSADNAMQSHWRHRPTE